jgi:hypothetical protein
MLCICWPSSVINGELIEAQLLYALLGDAMACSAEGLPVSGFPH